MNKRYQAALAATVVVCAGFSTWAARPLRTGGAVKFEGRPSIVDSRDDTGLDLGQARDRILWSLTQSQFGFGTPLAAPADASTVIAREDADVASKRVLLAGGLTARFISRKVAIGGDMIAFWPNDTEYTHLIVCNEQGRSGSTTPQGINSSVQRVNVDTGDVEIILRGMTACDGIRTTPWGTILATEEAGTSGRAYEILDPLGTTDQWIANRTTGDVRDGVSSSTASTKVVQRPRLGAFSWEGIAITPSGVVIAGDELRPSSGNEGGAIFKFIPTTLRSSEAGNISDLAQSPLASGTLYAWVGGSGSGETGQGTQRGAGRWIGPADWDDPSNPNDKSSTQWARDNNATGFYRPEDLHIDSGYTGAGVRVLWNNTQNEDSQHYGETLSLTDSDPDSSASKPVVQTFVEGNVRFNQPDNLDIQPKTGIVYVIEDHPFGEIYACLRDGADQDLQSDGCVPMLSVIDPDSEPTGFIFDGTGTRAYLHIQHGQQPASLLDFDSNPVNGQTDDLIVIEGFKTDNVPAQFPAWTVDYLIKLNR
ncbi:MAG: hypothetical protein U0V87_13245 [Acidobacteriota bacterium]